MAPGRRLGVFGGTFDPPHVGHSTAAAEVMEAVGLDRVLWVPAGVPPHKRGSPVTSATVRRRMVEAAVGDDPRFVLCDLELQRTGVSYTVDTLRDLRASRPGWTLFLILGSDLLAGFPSWREPEAIVGLAELVAVRRGGTPPPPVPGIDSRVHIVRIAPIDVSSSVVRRRIARGEAVSDMVVPRVMSIIESERLYRPRAAVDRATRRGTGGGRAKVPTARTW